MPGSECLAQLRGQLLQQIAPSVQARHQLLDAGAVGPSPATAPRSQYVVAQPAFGGQLAHREGRLDQYLSDRIREFLLVHFYNPMRWRRRRKRVPDSSLPGCRSETLTVA